MKVKKPFNSVFKPAKILASQLFALTVQPEAKAMSYDQIVGLESVRDAYYIGVAIIRSSSNFVMCIHSSRHNRLTALCRATSTWFFFHIALQRNLSTADSC